MQKVDISFSCNDVSAVENLTRSRYVYRSGCDRLVKSFHDS